MIENSGFGADKFTMVRNADGTGSLKVVQPLDYEDQRQRSGFNFKIQVNDKVSLIPLLSNTYLGPIKAKNLYIQKILDSL